MKLSFNGQHFLNGNQNKLQTDLCSFCGNLIDYNLELLSFKKYLFSGFNWLRLVRERERERARAMRPIRWCTIAYGTWYYIKTIYFVLYNSCRSTNILVKL